MIKTSFEEMRILFVSRGLIFDDYEIGYFLNAYEKEIMHYYSDLSGLKSAIIAEAIHIAGRSARKLPSPEFVREIVGQLLIVHRIEDEKNG